MTPAFHVSYQSMEQLTEANNKYLAFKLAMCVIISDSVARTHSQGQITENLHIQGQCLQKKMMKNIITLTLNGIVIAK